jgi:hypothetical protein
MSAPSFSHLSAHSNRPPSSNLDHPLAVVLGWLILFTSVGIHFYALGAKSDPNLLAYDESATWRSVDLPAATASEVLFARQDFTSMQPLGAVGTIHKLSPALRTQATLSLVNAASLTSTTSMEATLVALNFGY